MSKTLRPVALKLGDEVLVKIRTNTAIKEILEQLDKACKGGRIQDADGFDVTAHYSQDLPEGEYAIKQPTAGGPIAAAVRVAVSSMHANPLMVSQHLIVVNDQWSSMEGMTAGATHGVSPTSLAYMLTSIWLATGLTTIKLACMLACLHRIPYSTHKRHSHAAVEQINNWL